MGCTIEKTKKGKIMTFSRVFDIMIWFKRWGVEDLFELLDDAI